MITFLDRCLQPVNQQPAPGASGGAEARGAKGTRWYYDKSINGCKSFTASGENDQENNYRTEEECDKICGKFLFISFLYIMY